MTRVSTDSSEFKPFCPYRFRCLCFTKTLLAPTAPWMKRKPNRAGSIPGAARIPSRGIGIGIGVAAGAGGASRGVKRELESAGMDMDCGLGIQESNAMSRGEDLSGKYVLEQQKLERRVSERSELLSVLCVRSFVCLIDQCFFRLSICLLCLLSLYTCTNTRFLLFLARIIDDFTAVYLPVCLSVSAPSYSNTKCTHEMGGF